MAQGDNNTETFLEKDVQNDGVPDAPESNADSKPNKDTSAKKNTEVPQGERKKETPSSVDKERVKSKPIKLKRKKLEECNELSESTDAQSSVAKEEQKRKWGERYSRSRSRSLETEEGLSDKKKPNPGQKKKRNVSDDKNSRDVDTKDENVESDVKHFGRRRQSDSDSSDTDNHKTRKRKIRTKRSESSSSDSSSSRSSSSSDSDSAKSENESTKRRRVDGDKVHSSSGESQSSGKRQKKSNTSDSSDSNTASHRWEREMKNQTESSNEIKLEGSHYKSHGNKSARKSPSPRKTEHQKRSFNSQKVHSKDSNKKTSPREKRGSKEDKTSSSPSLGTEEHGKLCPSEKEKERVAKISKRKLSLSSRKDDHSSSTSERPHGKRKWGSSTKTISKPSLSISTDSLKDLIPDYKPIVKNVVVSSEELNAAASIAEEESSYNQQDTNTQPSDFAGIDENVVTESAAGKDDGQKDGDPRSPSPPQNPPSCILHIRNLVRPFTLHQLKEFLKRTGTLVEGGFWIDKIKSKCYVTYETQEQAVETRHALHGTRWPVSNPKTLAVDFATKEELDFHKELPDVSKLQTKKEKPEEKKSSISISSSKKLDDEKRRDRSDRTQPIREWDRDKLTQDSPEHEWQSKDKSRDRGRTPERREKKDKKDAKRKQEEETPAKLLDDLFRKTKAAPCIYWLPLTEEQIQLRMQDLRQRRLEREKRREQRDRQEKEKEEAERQQRQKARESRSGKEKESRQQSRSPAGRKR